MDEAADRLLDGDSSRCARESRRRPSGSAIASLRFIGATRRFEPEHDTGSHSCRMHSTHRDRRPIGTRRRDRDRVRAAARVGRYRWVDLRAAVLRRDDQLHRSPGDRHPQADAAAAVRLERDRLRRHRLQLSARLRDRAAAGGPVDRSPRHASGLCARRARVEPCGDGARRGDACSARPSAALLGMFGLAYAPSVAGFIAARFALGIGEAGNFPAAIKAVAEWFPVKERALCDRHLQLGHQHRRGVTPLVVPWITRDLRLVLGVHR